MTTLPRDDLVLRVEDLRTYVRTERGVVRCVDGADFEIVRGETLGLVGESGCGKTMAARSIMGLVSEFPGVVDGSIQGYFGHKQEPMELAQPLSDWDTGGKVVMGSFRARNRRQRHRYKALWGNRISMIFQDPQTALNPYWNIGDQLGEPVALSAGSQDKLWIKKKSAEWLERVYIHNPENVLESYPHELSGGMCQRVMIAMALASEPDLVIADEPTTGLDVTIQARIVELFKNLQAELKLSMLIISHDMGLISNLANRVAVMYSGRVVEFGRKCEVLEMTGGERHPYTVALLESIPALSSNRHELLPVIADSVPDPLRPPSGCAFHPRCPVYNNMDDGKLPCATNKPVAIWDGETHWVRCLKNENGDQRGSL